MKLVKKEYITLPNALTFSRLIGAIVLIFLRPLTKAFIIVFTLAGITDVLDGYIARKTGGETDFGSKLDSVSDLTFFTIMMLKIIPILFEKLPHEIWYFIFGIFGFRILIYILNFIKHRKFLSSHSYLNKASGIFMFGLPYFLVTKYLVPYSWSVVTVTGIAAIYEFTYSLIKPNENNH